MDTSAQTLPKLVLPDRIRRELRKGETIYHSTLPCHVSAKFPAGKWLGQLRREDKNGRLMKFPVKGFGTPSEALDYLRSLRPDSQGRIHKSPQGEPTVRDLFEFVTTHRQKRIGERTKAAKESRWRNYIENIELPKTLIKELQGEEFPEFSFEDKLNFPSKSGSVYFVQPRRPDVTQRQRRSCKRKHLP